MIKNIVFSFFVWCAGCDRDALDLCSKKEQIKHALFGGLVLVPAILGFFSMTYALSTTFGDVGIIYPVLGGLVWAMIVFVFDRFIVSTFKKKDNILKDIFSIVFFFRLIFSIGIGITVSHPLLLLIFSETIEQEIGEMAILEKQRIDSLYAVSINK